MGLRPRSSLNHWVAPSDNRNVNCYDHGRLVCKFPINVTVPGEGMGLVCAKDRIRQNYHCTNVEFEQALCLAAASGKIKRVFGGVMLARNV